MKSVCRISLKHMEAFGVCAGGGSTGYADCAQLHEIRRRPSCQLPEGHIRLNHWTKQELMLFLQYKMTIEKYRMIGIKPNTSTDSWAA